MPYTSFNGALPNSTTQNGTAFGQSARDNLNALRDACVMGGGFYGWALGITQGTGSASQPQYLVYTSPASDEKVMTELTWGTTAGEAGNVITAIYSYANSAGSWTWQTIKTKHITYDTSANVTSTSWT